jgi:hypothetical protein
MSSTLPISWPWVVVVQRVRSLVLASPITACQEYVDKVKANKLALLPAFYTDLLLNQKTTSPFYQSAVDRFRSVFFCRVANPYPDCVAQAQAAVAEGVFQDCSEDAREGFTNRVQVKRDGSSLLECVQCKSRHRQGCDARFFFFANKGQHLCVFVWLQLAFSNPCIVAIEVWIEMGSAWVG